MLLRYSSKSEAVSDESHLAPPAERRVELQPTWRIAGNIGRSQQIPYGEHAQGGRVLQID
jgi:hypothetical protein